MHELGIRTLDRMKWVLSAISGFLTTGLVLVLEA
jgi:hypothetical protein